MCNTPNKQALPARRLTTHRLVCGGRVLLSHSSRSKYPWSPSSGEGSCTELHVTQQRQGGEGQMKRTQQESDWEKCTEKPLQYGTVQQSSTHNVETRIWTYIDTLTCWVQAFCSHSWPATGNPGAPLNWTESPGGARWPAGMAEAHSPAPLLLDQQYYQVLDEGGSPPPSLLWLTGEQLLLPLEETTKGCGLIHAEAVGGQVCSLGLSKILRGPIQAKLIQNLAHCPNRWERCDRTKCTGMTQCTQWRDRL